MPTSKGSPHQPDDPVENNWSKGQRLNLTVAL
jgi:hypothetical protein